MTCGVPALTAAEILSQPNFRKAESVRVIQTGTLFVRFLERIRRLIAIPQA